MAMRLLVRGLALVALAAVSHAAAGLNHPAGKFVEVNGIKLWVEIEGKGEPLLLIAGGPGSSHAYFHPFFSPLSEHRQLIYFDAFGCGKSDRAKSSSEYTVARDVENIEALRNSLGFERFDVFGHSYGGMVAQAYVVKHPDRVKHLIIGNAVVSQRGVLQQVQDRLNGMLRDQLPERAEKLDRLRSGGVRSSAPEHQEAYDYPGGMVFFRSPDNAAKMPRTEAQLYNPELWYAMAGDDADFKVEGDLAGFDVSADLKKLKMPVLVIGGRFDRMVLPAFVTAFRSAAPQAQIVIFEKSGHFPFVEEPDEFLSLVDKFLE